MLAEKIARMPVLYHSHLQRFGPEVFIVEIEAAELRRSFLASEVFCNR